jgi:hypothetical protein
MTDVDLSHRIKRSAAPGRWATFLTPELKLEDLRSIILFESGTSGDGTMR